MGNLKLTLRTKLIALFIAVGVIPLTIGIGYAYIDAKNEMSSLVETQTTLLAHVKAEEIESIISEIKKATLDLARLPMTKAAMEELGSPFASARVDTSRQSYKEDLATLREFYRSQYAAEFKKKKGTDVDIERILGQLDPVAVVAQADFIARNRFSLGQKNQLVSSERESPYSTAHSKFHSFYNEFLSAHELYDIFLVGADGRVIYTTFKEIDFATSLESGPWRESGLALAYSGAKKLGRDQVFFSDLATYGPSFDSPAGFMAAPIVGSDGVHAGVVIVQFPVDRMEALLSKNDGGGDSADFYLLSHDGKLRSETHRVKWADLVKDRTTYLEANLKSDLVSQSLSQNEEEKTYWSNSYDGTEVIANVRKVKLANVEWLAVSEVSYDEAFKGLKQMRMHLTLFGAFAVGLIGFLAYFFGTKLSGDLFAVSEVLARASREVSSSSSQSAASSTELSEAATEQAASLQETMASVEEISAMVNQNAESATRAKSSVETNLVSANEGAKSVEEMLGSINEIKSTNDEILHQMESSNKEFAEIVKIISDIGDKTAVINDIVFQTKLLSFNASVEAARAGEHGKGFAVVAEEVGNLAQMSGNAAREITDMLGQSIKRVNSIVEQTRERVDRLVEVGQDKIAMGQSTAQRCKAALDKISENAQSMSSMVSEIAHASKEQAQGIQEINKAISQLDQVTQQNSAVAQQSSSQAEQLSAQASELQSAVENLVGLINGSSAAPVSVGAKSTVVPIGKKVASAKSVPKSTAKAAKSSASKPAHGAGKKVAGSDVVPSSDDAGFEEF